MLEKGYIINTSIYIINLIISVGQAFEMSLSGFGVNYVDKRSRRPISRAYFIYSFVNIFTSRGREFKVILQCFGESFWI